MPTYEYYCEICDDIEEVVHGMSEDPTIRCECGTLRSRVIAGTSHSNAPPTEFALKGEGWPSKTNRVAGHMAERRRVAQKKGFIEHPDDEGIIPNYEGETVKNWEEAKEAAKKKGTPVEEGSSQRRPLNAAELSTFDSKIEEVAKEKKDKDKKWDSVK